AAAPAFANTPQPYNMMIAMAERPPAAPLAPMLGNAGTQLFPFSRPMREVRQHVASPVPLVASVNLPLNPMLQTIFTQQRKVVLTSKAKAACTFYQVASGDSLYAIAADLLGSGARWREIYEANKSKITRGYTVYPGMRLVIPTPRQIREPEMLAKAKATHPAAVAHAKPAVQTADSNRYHVEKGDSLYVIAQKALHDPLRWREILSLNKQTLQGKTVIYPNQWLVLPSES
ncbi:MAG TPA: LysM peptidoglycan-binding domain-containing protein, partial [Oscillatoriaceae cyanobacterium]